MLPLTSHRHVPMWPMADTGHTPTASLAKVTVYLVSQASVLQGFRPGCRAWDRWMLGVECHVSEWVWAAMSVNQ